MPNIQSQIKRDRTSKIANTKNSEKKASLRTTIKKFDAAIAANADNVQELFAAATKAIDQAETKGLIHKNKASRDKSRLAKKLAK
ncbi:MAG: 30S ribosomal protein S20 [Lactobacillales bacterium]|jgi:small subunit ribosomal protein S20|nr:30S ribosomal protein S20 [Lactobacillales bacterium]